MVKTFDEGATVFNVVDSPASSAFAITPSDSTVFAQPTRGLYVGISGNLAVRMKDQTLPPTFVSAAVGYHPLQVDKVLSTGTTATNIIGLY